MLCVEPDSLDYVKQVAAASDGSCANWVLLSKNEFALIDSVQITAADILTDLTWGAGVVLLFWSLGYAVGIAKKVISAL